MNRVNQEGIGVRLDPPTIKGRLWPNYDRESDIVTISSKIRRPWPHGVDIDGNVVFDLDQGILLANVDLHVGKRLWRQQSLWSWDSNARAYDIRFDSTTLKLQSFSLSLEVRTDRKRSHVEIDFSEGVDCDRIVALSNSCQIRLRGRILLGLHVAL